MTIDVRSIPIDPTSSAEAVKQGLRIALVDPADRVAYSTWLQAVMRGFNASRVDEDGMPKRQESSTDHRITGIWDDTASDAATPVATSSSWVADLTVPGRGSIPAWAISTVSVAPSHRRRGLARAIIGAELRGAAELGLPVAILTASEATIYSRFGFAPAAMQADWTIDTKRARWIGPEPDGRVQLVQNDVLREGVGHELVEQVRLDVPGQIEFHGMLWHRMFGTLSDDKGKDLRVAQYDDASGSPQGFALYKVSHSPEGHNAALDLKYLVAATDDAYAALWKFLIEVDLITSVKASLRPIDEPVQWQIADARAAVKSHESDHLWVRVLDVPAALEARTYGAAGRILLDIADPMGFADGRYLLDIAEDGTAKVTSANESGESSESGDADASLKLGVTELGAIYLGGVSIKLLVRAGRISEMTPGSATFSDAAFRSDVTPWLSIWF